MFKRKIWSFSNTDFREYQSVLKNQNWDSFLSNDIDQTCNSITKCIIESATETIPNKTIMSRHSDPPWMHNIFENLLELVNVSIILLSTLIPPETGQNIENREIFV